MAGNVVMDERTDTFHVGGRATSLRVMGTFEVNYGLITAWRDYFDLAQGDRPWALRSGQPRTGGCAGHDPGQHPQVSDSAALRRTGGCARWRR